MNDEARSAKWRTRYLVLRRRWPGIQLALDALVWLVCIPGAVWLRYDFTWPRTGTGAVVLAAAASALCFAAVATWAGLYRRRYRYGSADEAEATVWAVVVTVAITVLGTLLVRPSGLPVSAPLIGGPLALVALVGMRHAALTLLYGLSRPGSGAQPVLIYGAGDAGGQLVAAMVRNPLSHYLPVGLIDDAPSNAKLSLHGVKVLGNGNDLAAAAAATGARLVVLAMPSAGGVAIRTAFQRAQDAGLAVKTLPTLAELDSPTVGPAQIRSVTEADLLGRGPVDTDVAAIADYVSGRRILVTGAGGSIGSELCRQLHRFGPAELVMVDRDESALHAVQLSIEGRALLDTPNLVVADIRDAPRMHEVFGLHRPQVVFHAAALKHLPLLELHPDEGVKTNVWGTQHLLEAAMAHGVERFVNISTDKAANPTSVLGKTKRLAERLTAHAAELTGRPYLSVRFGNVLGSRGSVVPAFQAMIDAGGPLTVTHPEVTRYFMTVQEAVELVIQAAAIGSGGEVLILDMGEPVRIADIARRLIASSGRDIAIEFTGLRPGEKLHEELIGEGEMSVSRSHRRIRHAVVPPMQLRSGMSIESAGDLAAWSEVAAFG